MNLNPSLHYTPVQDWLPAGAEVVEEIKNANELKDVTGETKAAGCRFFRGCFNDASER